MSRPLIVAVCGDAGGASAMAPVLVELMRARRVSVHAFAYLQSRETWARAQIPFRALTEDLDTLDLFDAVGLADAQLLLVGTSVNAQDYERKLIACARELDVPSLALLDFWSNYRERFDDDTGALRYLSDSIAVMDERAREEMCALGFDAARLVVTGQPAFDGLQGIRMQFDSARRRKIREDLAAQERSVRWTLLSRHNLGQS